MHTMMLLVLLASICLQIQPNIAEEVNSLFHNISKRTTNQRCGPTVGECMKSNSRLVKSCKVCGLWNSGMANFIVSGDIVTPQHKYPWMVSLMVYGQHFCGGSLISDSYILTAAHCLEEYPATSIKIGFLSPSSRVTSGHPVERTIMHPKYSTKNNGVYFDFGLIKLKKKISCDEYKNPVCLPPANARLPLKTALTIMGWGRYSRTKEETSQRLLEAQASVIDTKQCGRTGNDLYCFKAKRLDQAACLGDSGGPAIIQQKEKYFSFGVASFVFDNCNPAFPFGYAQVASVMDWITKITGVKPEKFK